jgi:hypothetical protein
MRQAAENACVWHMIVALWCFTICLCFTGCPDMSGLRRIQGTKKTLIPQDPQQVAKPKYEATALQAHPTLQTGSMMRFDSPRYVFTICLFISPDLDGHTICFTMCLFISLDLDGHGHQRWNIVPAETHKRPQNPNTKPLSYIRIQVQAALTLPTGSIHCTTALLSGEATSASHDLNQRLRQSPPAWSPD